MAVSFEVPTIDISAFDGDDPVASAAVVDAVRTACENVGFFLLADRGGVPEDLVRDALAASRGFFELPLDEKMRVASLKRIHPRRRMRQRGTADEPSREVLVLPRRPRHRGQVRSLLRPERVAPG